MRRIERVGGFSKCPFLGFAQTIHERGGGATVINRYEELKGGGGRDIYVWNVHVFQGIEATVGITRMANAFTRI